MQPNKTKEKGKEKEEALNTPIHATVSASISGITAPTKEDVTILCHIIEKSEKKSDERM